MSILPEQNTPEWKEWRKNKIGASDIPIIMGVSPYKTPLQLWKLKLGFDEEQETYATIYGKDTESHVRQLVQQDKGKYYHPKTIQHPEIDWAIASLDGISEDGEIIEIKCANAEDHDTAKKGYPPSKYSPQLQWQMFVSGASKVLYCSFNKDELVVVESERDEDLINACLESAKAFLYHLMTYTPPAHSEKDYIKIDSPEFGRAAISWLQANEMLMQAKQQEEFFRKVLIDMTDDGNCEGYGIRMTRVERRGSVNMDALCKDYQISQEDLNKYRGDQIGFWKISKISSHK
jgi:putative phage-type endonuclease